MADKAMDEGSAAPGATAEAVAAFLKANPDFLACNPDLLARMTAPARWNGNGVVDLQQVMIQHLRGELDKMRGCAEHLIATSRSNMSNQTRIHHAALAVLAAGGMDQVARAVNDDFPHLLDVDVASLCFETSERAIPELAAAGIQRLPGGAVDRALGDATRPLLLRDHAAGDPALFSGGAGLVESYALARLAPGCPLPCGLLVLGAREPDAFHPGQGAELLSFLARIVEYAVHRWVAQAE